MACAEALNGSNFAQRVEHLSVEKYLEGNLRGYLWDICLQVQASKD